MWERFCFCGMRALLTLYVAQGPARPEVASHVLGFQAVRHEQQGSSLQFWADESTELHVFRWLGSDWHMPSTWFQSVNPAFILLCTRAPLRRALGDENESS